METQNDLLAKCLAAEEHPHLQEEADFQTALEAVQASPELQKQLDEARTFFARHPVLIEADGMPSDVRERIAQALSEAQPSQTPAGKQILGPWQVRRHFAWAAAMVLLLTGMSLLSSTILEQQNVRRHQRALSQMPPQDAFRSEVGRLVKNRISLQRRSADSTQLVSWLGDQGLDGISAPDGLMPMDSIGCSQFEAPFGKIGVVCFDVNGEVVHLFVACSKQMGLQKAREPEKLHLQGRDALQWNDEKNLYLVIPHEVDTELPQVFL